MFNHKKMPPVARNFDDESDTELALQFPSKGQEAWAAMDCWEDGYENP